MAVTNKRNVNPSDAHRSLQPDLESSFDVATSGIPGNEIDMANMLGRDGKWLCGGEIECYATGRADREAPPFPGVGGNLRGAGRR